MVALQIIGLGATPGSRNIRQLRSVFKSYACHMVKNRTFATPDAKRAWLAENRTQFDSPKAAVAGLRQQFGSALAYPEIANILAGRKARAGYAKPGKRKAKKG